ncbi:MAG: PspC domain-containing protein [Actinomycetota bacterium]
MKRLYRDVEHQRVAGVAAGLARYVGIDPLIVRSLFVASIFLGGAGLVLYLVAWLIINPAPAGYWDADGSTGDVTRIYRDPDDKRIFGVCGGIGRAFDVDPTVVRLVFVVAVFFGGAGLVAYLALAIALEPRPPEPDHAEVDDGPGAGPS